MKVTTLSIIELRSLFEKIVSYYDDNNIKELQIDYGYYWGIDSEQTYNIANTPSSFELGDVDFELELLRDATKDNLIGYELKWFAAIITAAVDTKFRAELDGPSQCETE